MSKCQSVKVSKDLIESIRPKQWTKNLLIFAALLFTANLTNINLLVRSTLAFILFCLLAGSAYILNDLSDLEEDKAHPLKCKRPLPSGRLKVSYALGFSLFLATFSLTAGYYLSFNFFLTALAYLLLNLIYSLSLKNVVIVDVLSISLGFVLRAIAGAVVIEVVISPWLLICTLLLALFLALGKRRQELTLLKDKAGYHRRILKRYSSSLLDQMISVVTSSTVIAYCLYTFTSETAQKAKFLMLTMPFVLYGIFRYLYLIYQKGEGGEPETILLKDKPLIINILLWIIACGIIIQQAR